MFHAFNDDVAATGWAISHKAGPTKRFQVLGERSSGTNFITRLVERNTELKNSDVLGWKHGMPMALAIPSDLTVICTFRAANSWALSMHAKPWHCSPTMQELEFSKFIRAPWNTIIDRPRYFPWVAKPEYRGQPLQADRHPVTGEMFANLFELRAMKIAAQLSFARRHNSCIFVRMEAVQAAPEAFMADVRAQLSMPDTAIPFKAVTKRLGFRFKPGVKDRPPTPRHMSASDYDWMCEWLDLRVEKALGYRY